MSGISELTTSNWRSFEARTMFTVGCTGDASDTYGLDALARSSEVVDTRIDVFRRGWQRRLILESLG